MSRISGLSTPVPDLWGKQLSPETPPSGGHVRGMWGPKGRIEASASGALESVAGALRQEAKGWGPRQELHTGVTHSGGAEPSLRAAGSTFLVPTTSPRGSRTKPHKPTVLRTSIGGQKLSRRRPQALLLPRLWVRVLPALPAPGGPSRHPGQPHSSSCPASSCSSPSPCTLESASQAQALATGLCVHPN